MAEGKIIAISISEKKGQKKHNIESANLIVDYGMEGDAHAGNWHRQISLLGIKSIEHMREKGADVKPGDFAENITVEGIVLYDLPVAVINSPFSFLNSVEEAVYPSFAERATANFPSRPIPFRFNSS